MGFFILFMEKPFQKRLQRLRWRQHGENIHGQLKFADIGLRFSDRDPVSLTGTGHRDGAGSLFTAQSGLYMNGDNIPAGEDPGNFQ